MSNNNDYEDEKKYHVGHVYEEDIVELNHPAPAWWQICFYLSIVFGVGYFFYYEVFDGPTLKQELAVKMAVIDAENAKNAPKGPSNDEVMAIVKDPAALKVGKEVFTSKCASCHAPDGGGLIGPNLTDKFWIHGDGSVAAIFKVVNEGVADKGMPPWGPVLPANEMKSVIAFVKSIQGTTPATAKAPQGTEIK